MKKVKISFFKEKYEKMKRPFNLSAARDFVNIKRKIKNMIQL
ncbi:hypothetical protein bthur0010_60280 [Bacillus thuringiensis serovar pondicheriensis BGSC 4BA1]|nr:hypothetical protein bthur0010_60280 [Bacillus thuringiensis serovar pondicheriensis BGSC 4BA1]